MPRYFFNRTDGFVDQDTVGTELEDVNAARLQAVIFAGESLKDNPKYVWNGHDFRVEVLDELGRVVLTFVAFAVDGDEARRTLATLRDR